MWLLLYHHVQLIITVIITVVLIFVIIVLIRSSLDFLCYTCTCLQTRQQVTVALISVISFCPLVVTLINYNSPNVKLAALGVRLLPVINIQNKTDTLALGT